MPRKTLRKTLRTHLRLLGALFTATLLLVNVARPSRVVRAARRFPESVRTGGVVTTRSFFGQIE